MRFYGDIQRVDEEQRMVWGYASTEQRAMDGQVVTRSALEGALDDYMAFANIREMHSASSAAGVAREAHVDEGGLYIGAHVVDDQAWKKVVERVYKGFSIGAKVTDRDTLDRNTITGILIREISLVDRPSDPGAVFDVFRVDGAESDEDDTPIEENDMARAAARPAATPAETPANPAEAPADGVQRAAGEGEAAPAGEEHPGEDGAAAAPAAEEPGADAAAEFADETERAATPEAEPAAEEDADPVARAVQAAEAASAGLGAAVEAVERAASGEEPPPGVVVICGAGPAAELRRSMGMVSRLGSVLSELAYIIADAAWEAEYEGDNSPVPEKLRDGIKLLAAAFKSMSEEEVNELLASVSATAGVEGAIIMYAASGADLERSAGVAFTEDQTQVLQTALDGFIARGFVPTLPGADETDLQRQVVELTAGRDTLQRSVEALTGQMTELTERVQRFADAPAAPKTGGALARAIDKGEDAAGAPADNAAHVPTGEDVQRVLAAMDPEERALLLTRAALARPLPITR